MHISFPIARHDLAAPGSLSQLPCHRFMRKRASIETRAQLGNLPLQPVEHRFPGGGCLPQRGRTRGVCRLLAGFRPPPVPWLRGVRPTLATGALRAFWGLCHARAAPVLGTEPGALAALFGS